MGDFVIACGNHSARLSAGVDSVTVRVGQVVGPGWFALGEVVFSGERASEAHGAHGWRLEALAALIADALAILDLGAARNADLDALKARIGVELAAALHRPRKDWRLIVALLQLAALARASVGHVTGGADMRQWPRVARVEAQALVA